MDSLIVNKAIICGTLMHSPQFDLMNDGSIVCRMIPITIEHWTEHDEEYDSPDVKYRELHEVLVYGRLAEFAFTELTAWSKIYVEGVMRDMRPMTVIDEYQKDPRNKIVIIATELKHLGNIPKLHESDARNSITPKKLPDYCYKRDLIPACVWTNSETRPASRNEPQSLDDEFWMFC